MRPLSPFASEGKGVITRETDLGPSSILSLISLFFMGPSTTETRDRNPGPSLPDCDTSTGTGPPAPPPPQARHASSRGAPTLVDPPNTPYVNHRLDDLL